MDLSSATREQFTQNLVSRPLSEDAAADWKLYAQAHQTLLDKLARHDSMSANLQQTYMTPAASKNKVYFMWDFVGRTLGMIYNLPPAKDPARYNAEQQELWTDVISRTVMAKSLLTDERPGMLDMMIESTNPDQRGQHPDLGADAMAASRALP